MDKIIHALSATVFIALFFIGILTYGGKMSQFFALGMVLAVAASQMFAQGGSQIQYKTALILQYIAAALAFIALFCFVIFA